MYGDTGGPGRQVPGPDRSGPSGGQMAHVPVNVVPWVQLFDQASQTMYYYNTITRVTQWEPPNQPFQPVQLVVCPTRPMVDNAQGAVSGNHHHPLSHAVSYAHQDNSLGAAAGQSQRSNMESGSLGNDSKAGEVSSARGALVQTFPDEEEANTSDEDSSSHGSVGRDSEMTSKVADRCWGRPGRTNTIDSEPDNETSLPGKFRRISSIDQKSLLSFAQLSEKGSAGSKRGGSRSSLRMRVLEDALEDANKSTKPQSIRRVRERANTTNTMYVTSTMAEPDAQEELQCVAAVIHAHMVQFMLCSPSNDLNPRYAIFDENPNAQATPPPAPQNRRRHSRGGSFGVKIPTRMTIFSFVKNVYEKAQMEKECIIMSFAYLERLLKCTKGKLTLNDNNWQAIVLSTMILASKVWDDLSMWNADFSLICPGFTLKRINELEICLLEAMKYEVRISQSQYAKYYFQLRSMRKALGIAVPKTTPRKLKVENPIRRSGSLISQSMLADAIECNAKVNVK
mmetsp:Transcript_18153/g.29461  ORF Transcript_18153/g.29461 Transcript_18153/m.29461 type:complete len:510 (+) Transcript_18153:56-1585(+)